MTGASYKGTDILSRPRPGAEKCLIEAQGKEAGGESRGKKVEEDEEVEEEEEEEEGRREEGGRKYAIRGRGGRRKVKGGCKG